MKLSTKNCMIKTDDKCLIGLTNSIAESIKDGDLNIACFEAEQMFLAMFKRLKQEGYPFELTNVKKIEREVDEFYNQPRR